MLIRLSDIVINIILPVVLFVVIAIISKKVYPKALKISVQLYIALWVILLIILTLYMVITGISDNFDEFASWMIVLTMIVLLPFFEIVMLPILMFIHKKDTKTFSLLLLVLFLAFLLYKNS